MIQFINRIGPYFRYIFLISLLVYVIVFYIRGRNTVEWRKSKPFHMAAIIFTVIFTIGIAIFVLVHDDNSASSWCYEEMNYSKLVKYSKGKSQTIAFIDTGISTQYENKIGGRIIKKYNAVDDTEDVRDFNGHGTEMISIACGNGYKDVYGLAQESKIIVIKVTSDEGTTNNQYLIKALQYAYESGATIVNVSLGGMKYSEKVEEMVDAMYREGVTILAAAGDYDNKDLLFPASLKNVIAVQNTDRDGKLWEECNTTKDNKKNIIKYPGVDIKSVTFNDGNIYTVNSNGTSQATAVASGYVAVVKDYYKKIHGKDIDNQKLVELLKKASIKGYLTVIDDLK